MRKLLTLLFIVMLSHNNYAHRMLTIVNKTKASVEQTIYALQLTHFNQDEGRQVLYRFVLDPITLKPDKSISFTQLIPGDSATFPYCASPPISPGDYFVHNYCDFNSELPYQKISWAYGLPGGSTRYVLEQCTDVPAYQFVNNITFEGFKFCEYRPIPNNQNPAICGANPMRPNNELVSIGHFDRFNIAGSAPHVEYDTLGNMNSSIGFIEIVRIN